MRINNSRINVKAKVSSRITSCWVDHVIGKRLSTIPCKHHAGLALIIYIGIDMLIEIFTCISCGICIVFEIAFNCACTIGMRIICLSERLLRLLIIRKIQRIICRCIPIMIIHIPTIGICRINRNCRRCNTEITSTHALFNQLFRQFLLKFQKGSRIVSRHIDSNIDLRGRIGTYINPGSTHRYR